MAILNSNYQGPQHTKESIKIIGVGGGGGNAVNHMYLQNIHGVDFIICNTDRQVLDVSPVPSKIILGESLTGGNGAGSLPNIGKDAAIESINDVLEVIGKNTRIVFITAGMGGGTGTGAAPIIARACKEKGILTVGIVTYPFSVEGPRRRKQADEGLAELKTSVDTLLVINNDKLMEIHGDLKIKEAFRIADNVLTTAAKSIAEIITKTLFINVDFADIKTVIQDSGVAIMGAGRTSGEDRATKAVKLALDSPLLNNAEITGARYVLLNITYGENEITMNEFKTITEYVQAQAGESAELISGQGEDSDLAPDEIMVTIVATGFGENKHVNTKVVLPFSNDKVEEPKAIENTMPETTTDLNGFVVKQVDSLEDSTTNVNTVEPTNNGAFSNAPSELNDTLRRLQELAKQNAPSSSTIQPSTDLTNSDMEQLVSQPAYERRTFNNDDINIEESLPQEIKDIIKHTLNNTNEETEL